mmetsp:Transcript_21379/g.59707  ORF Transcript_21379/g.59707 Transcript_21379/m.59707 type:complete len:204 (+) Transcript_21379:125-736(+)
MRHWSGRRNIWKSSLASPSEGTSEGGGSGRPSQLFSGALGNKAPSSNSPESHAPGPRPRPRPPSRNCKAAAWCASTEHACASHIAAFAAFSFFSFLSFLSFFSLLSFLSFFSRFSSLGVLSSFSSPSRPSAFPPVAVIPVAGAAPSETVSLATVALKPNPCKSAATRLGVSTTCWGSGVNTMGDAAVAGAVLLADGVGCANAS